MREEAAATEALLVDFEGTEAGAVGGAVGWAPPSAGFAPFAMPTPERGAPPPYVLDEPPLPHKAPASAPYPSPPPPSSTSTSTYNIPPNNLNGPARDDASPIANNLKVSAGYPLPRSMK